MDKTTLIGAGILLTVGVTMFLLIGCGGSKKYQEAVAKFRTRLVEARDATTDDASERLIEGTVRASAGAPSSTSPTGKRDVVAWAAWTQVHVSAGSKIYRADELSLGGASFELDTAEGVLIVDGELRGVSDLVRREQGPPGAVEVAIVVGDHVSVLGPVSERDGKRGFHGDVTVVKGTPGEWHAMVGTVAIGSIPEQP